MNIQHSSRTDRWFTPVLVLERVRKVLGRIDFDPASEPAANLRVQAGRYLTEEEDGLSAVWSGANLFINPPGGKRDHKSSMALFWQKLMDYRNSGELDHAIFLAFSLEALQVTQGKGCLPIASFPFCVPSSRIRFDNPDGSAGKAPSHSNMIVYVPGRVNEIELFSRTFEDIGAVLNTRRHP